MTHSKKDWRKKIRQILSELPTNQKQEEDKKILQRVFQTPEYQQAYTIFAYISLPHEIETRPLLEKILADGKRLALPLCLDEKHMQARIVSSLQELTKNHYGIEEPSLQDPILSKEEIDLVIVPCLAVSKEGYRLGHGGGYYDRYFAEGLPTAIVMCREACLLNDFPHEEYDVRIPIVITEKKTYR